MKTKIDQLSDYYGSAFFADLARTCNLHYRDVYPQIRKHRITGEPPKHPLRKEILKGIEILFPDRKGFFTYDSLFEDGEI